MCGRGWRMKIDDSSKVLFCMGIGTYCGMCNLAERIGVLFDGDEWRKWCNSYDRHSASNQFDDVVNRFEQIERMIKNAKCRKKHRKKKESKPCKK
jgi:hypothetical protein